jgi:hypothetical protein
MARQPRIECPGAIYHVMARGDRRGRVVHERVAFPGHRGEIVCEDWEREHLNELRERL